MPEDADRELIGRILAGGTDGKVAFRALYERYQKQVFTICYRLMGDSHRAADATQESFLAVLRGLKSFEFQSSFKTWLFQVTKNAALQQLRKPSSRSLLSTEEPGETGDESREVREATEQDAPDQLEQAIESEFAGDMQNALTRLRAQHREILSLRYFGDLSYEELAEILGCSIGTIKSRLSRAHRALKPHLLEVMKRHHRTVPTIGTSGLGTDESEPEVGARPA